MGFWAPERVGNEWRQPLRELSAYRVPLPTIVLFRLEGRVYQLQLHRHEVRELEAILAAAADLDTQDALGEEPEGEP